MARYAAPDLTGLTAPDVVEELDYEVILDLLKTDITTRLESMGIDYDVASLESDPVVKILEVAAYRETLLRARVNTAARAIMLAYAQENDLDQLGVYYGVERQITGYDADSNPIYETDTRLRTRIQLAPEALSVAGPVGAYEFHAMSVDTTVKSVAVYSPDPGEVHVYPLVDTGDGTPSQSVLEKIQKKLAETDIRPLTDMVQVMAPTKVAYTVDVSLEIDEGPDEAVVKAAAAAAIQKYADSRHIVATHVHLSGIIAAAHVSGVVSVTVNSPTADVEPKDNEFAYMSALTVAIV